MPSATPIDVFFRTSDFAQPATFTNAAGLSKELDVLPETNYQGTFIGESEVDNARTTVIAREEDLPSVDTESTLVLHDFITDELDNRLTDESGDDLIAEGIGTYQIRQIERDGFGMMRLYLHTN